MEPRLAARLEALSVALDCTPRRSAWSSVVPRRRDGSTVDGSFAVVARWRLGLQAAIGDAAAGDTRLCALEASDRGTESPDDQVTGYTMLLAEMPQRQHWSRGLKHRHDVDSADVLEELNRLKMSLQARLGDAMELQSRRGSNGPSPQT